MVSPGAAASTPAWIVGASCGTRMTAALCPAGSASESARASVSTTYDVEASGRARARGARPPRAHARRGDGGPRVAAPVAQALLRGTGAVVVQRRRHVRLVREPERDARRRDRLLRREVVERAAGDRVQARARLD